MRPEKERQKAFNEVFTSIKAAKEVNVCLLKHQVMSKFTCGIKALESWLELWRDCDFIEYDKVSGVIKWKASTAQ